MNLYFKKSMLLLQLLAVASITKETKSIELPGLARLYKFEGDVNDSSSSMKHLTPVPKSTTANPGVPLYTVDELVSYEQQTLRNGASRQVARLHGKGGFFADAEGLPDGDSPRTMMGWFKRDAFTCGTYPSGICMGNSIFGYGGYIDGVSYYETNFYSTMTNPCIYTNCNNFQLSPNWWESSYHYYPIGNSDWSATPWVHFTFTWDGNNMRSYINGNLHKTSGTPTYTMNTTVDITLSAVYVGAHHFDVTWSQYVPEDTAPEDMTGYPPNGWLGHMADFAIFDRALSASEIQSVYNDPNGVEAPPFTASPTTSPTDSPTLTPTLTPSAKPSISPSMTSADKFEWYITPLTNGTMNGETALVMEYNISNHKFDFNVFQEDCSTQVEGALDETEIVTSLGDGFVNVTASIAINQTEIESYGSDIWTSSIDGGEMKFCVVLSLLLEDENEDIIINFVETTYKIDVDKTTNFSIVDVVTERTGALDGGTTSIDYEEDISTFQCYDDYSPIDPVPSLTQGDILQVCVQVEDDESIFEVDYVQDMNITQAGNDNSPVVVVSNGTDFTYDELTFTECDGGTNQICRIKFQLLAMFFENSDPADLDVNGILSLKLKDSRLRRSLSHTAAIGFRNNGGNVANRNAAENESENSFELHVSLENENESASYMNRVTAVSAALLTMAGGLYGLW